MHTGLRDPDIELMFRLVRLRVCLDGNDRTSARAYAVRGLVSELRSPQQNISSQKPIRVAPDAVLELVAAAYGVDPRYLTAIHHDPQTEHAITSRLRAARIPAPRYRPSPRRRLEPHDCVPPPPPPPADAIRVVSKLGRHALARQLGKITLRWAGVAATTIAVMIGFNPAHWWWWVIGGGLTVALAFIVRPLTTASARVNDALRIRSEQFDAIYQQILRNHIAAHLPRFLTHTQLPVEFFHALLCHHTPIGPETLAALARFDPEARTELTRDAVSTWTRTTP